EQTSRPLFAAPLPRIGMPSGIGVPNPGISVWVFLGISRLFRSTTPPELSRAVQITNVAALGALLWLTVRLIPLDQRERWLWATALAEVNPTEVVLRRSIWA